MATDPGAAIQVPQWGRFEVALDGPSSGNPFVEVELSALFRQGERALEVPGFYDGDGTYRVRFMPDTQGSWEYETRSSHEGLAGRKGRFEVGPAEAHNHGPVRVAGTFHFAHADGTPFKPFGTTAYVWNHQGDALEEQTLRTLATAPFNKLRMCVFPKHHRYNETEPEFYPYRLIRRGSSRWNGSYYTDRLTPEELEWAGAYYTDQKTEWEFDFDSFEPAFFRHLEQRIDDLHQIGVEAELILFHAYDRWGFAHLSSEQRDRYLRYLVARLAGYANIWWSLGNEFDHVASMTMDDWHRAFEIVAEHDHAQHLRSIHNGAVFYDHSRPLVTHASIQRWDPSPILTWRQQYQKPVIVDECCYEGDLGEAWGSITGREMTHRCWTGVTNGGYVTHGETFRRPDDEIFWSKGGTLQGESIPRLRFLRKLVECISSSGLEPMVESFAHRMMEQQKAGMVGPIGPRRDEQGDPTVLTQFPGVCVPHETYLMYFGSHQPSEVVIWTPVGEDYRATLIDTWEMTERPLDGTLRYRDVLSLPPKPYQALLLSRSN